ncbi:MAG: response regulator transcription factor [Rhodobacteraceae bacterium]|nr:response regulator transcription factor [Paracoccaceae bacterium]
MDSTATRTLNSAMIVDDHPLFCDALSMTMRAAVGIEEIRTAATLEEGISRLEDGFDPDVILLDLNLPDVSGLDGLVRLKSVAQDTPIVVVSSMSDERVLEAARRAGASGFVPKHSQRETFRAAFDEIAAGRPHFPHDYSASDSAETGGVANPDEALHRLGQLTRQQAKILQLICLGKLNKQIAYDLSIAETTVKAHVTAIMRKLGVQSRTQAVLIAKEASFANILQDGSAQR